MGAVALLGHTLRGLVLKALAILIVSGGVAWLVSGNVRYVLRAAVAEAGILARARPISIVIADPKTDAATRAKLTLVLAARDFAADSLHLAARKTYTTYSRVAHDTLVFVLSASRADRLEAHTWSFPVVGRVPYKGFFSLAHARAEQGKLEREGLDTYLRVSDAFSTLGWFNDPLLSTIVGEDSVDLVATVIHEITHNTIWVPGHVPFNESLADFVGYHGAQDFFRERGDTLAARFAAARWSDELVLGRFYDTLTARLERLYASGAPDSTLLRERQAIFQAARDDLAGATGHELLTIDGAAMARRPLNNAVVIAARIYRTHLTVLERVLAAHQGRLVPTIAAIKQAEEARGSRDPWAVLAQQAGEPAGSASGGSGRPAGPP